jgi:hypothetical protein
LDAAEAASYEAGIAVYQMLFPGFHGQ